MWSKINTIYHKKEYGPINNWHGDIENFNAEEKLDYCQYLVEYHPKRQEDDPCSRIECLNIRHRTSVTESTRIDSALTHGSCYKVDEC